MADVTINNLTGQAPTSTDVFPFATTGVTPSTYKATLAQIKTALAIPAAQIQSDWTQTNSSALDYIKNKPIIKAQSVSGGTSSIITVGGTRYLLITYTSSGILGVFQDTVFDYLVVGAGGGATGGINNVYFGSGAAGGTVRSGNSIFSANYYNISVGSGGVGKGGGNAFGNNGGASSIGSLIVSGGGQGGQGQSGGNNDLYNGAGPQGGTSSGAGAGGGASTTNTVGGAGFTSSITGSSITYAGGGGSMNSAGGAGGGGAGSTGGRGGDATYYGGGGGGGQNCCGGGNGYQGIVIVRFTI